MKKISVVFVLFVVCLAFGGYAWAGGSVMSGEAFSGNPVLNQPVWSNQPPVISESQKALLESMIDKTHLPGPPTPGSGAALAAPVPGTETSPGGTTMVPGDLVIRRNADLSSIVPAGYASHVLEPSVVNEGMFVFYTANWFAARSTSAGAGGTWSYINTFTDFPSFCCDQDTAYDPARRALLWYRQGIADGSGNNIFKLGVSSDGGASFCTYDTAPSNVNAGWTNQWFDYPHVALSNNYLYIASNVFNASNTWVRTVVLRWPLDSLATCSGFSYQYLNITDRFNLTPVQGATTTMYFGTHNSTTSLRVYTWPESSTSATITDVTVPAWSATTRGSAICTTGDSFNPCARFDDRILSGWIANWGDNPGEKYIGFFWNVKQDGVTFMKPYTNSAVFKQSDLTYVATPSIYNSGGAWIYGVGAPNARGDLGVSLFWVPTGGYPSHVVMVRDDYNNSSWSSNTITNFSVAGPSDNKWGDYVRVHPHNPAGLQWTATGYSIPASAANNSTPRYIIFGRERDNKSLNRWLLN